MISIVAQSCLGIDVDVCGNVRQIHQWAACANDHETVLVQLVGAQSLHDLGKLPGWVAAEEASRFACCIRIDPVPHRSLTEKET